MTECNSYQKVKTHPEISFKNFAKIIEQKSNFGATLKDNVTTVKRSAMDVCQSGS